MTRLCGTCGTCRWWKDWTNGNPTLAPYMGDCTLFTTERGEAAHWSAHDGRPRAKLQLTALRPTWRTVRPIVVTDVDFGCVQHAEKQ